MKPVRSLFMGLILGINGLMFSHLSCAYSEYTYTSDTLSWDSTLLYSEIYDSVVTFDGAEPPRFGFSFVLPADTPSNVSLSLKEVEVWVNPEFFGWYQFPLTTQNAQGSIQLDSTGMPLAWDFSFVLRELVTPENSLHAELRNLSIDIHSSGGPQTCNCDKLRQTNNIYT